MASLEGVLARIPFLAGYTAQDQQNRGREHGDLQSAGALQGILARMQAKQEQEQLRGVMEQSGGDPAKAVQALLSAGTPKSIELATKLKGMMPKPAEPYTLGPDQVRMGPDNEEIARGVPRASAQSIGSGGLRLADGTVVPPAARPGGTNEPLHPIVGPDGKPVLVPRSQAVGKTPFNASIAGSGQFTPEALRMTAEQYLTGDRQAIMGYARNAPARIALQNEIQKVAKEKGWSGADVAAQMADFVGIMSGSRTVGTRAAQIELASSEADKMIDIVLERSKGFERTQFVPINKALKAFETQTGQPEVKAFGAAINSLVNVYARAISPSGVPTVSDKEHAREMLAAADSPAQVQAVMDVMRQEMKAARAAPGDVRASTRKAVTGAEASAPAAAPASPAGGGAWTPEKEQRYQELLKKRGP